MYVPAHYRSQDRQAALDVIGALPLATTISVADGMPFVSYIPFTIRTAEPKLVLAGHCARANPHWKLFEASPVLLIFRGPDGYISPRFTPDCASNVPTWNYVAVHCTGTAQLAPAEETDGILRALVEQMEGTAEGRWRMEDLDAEHLERLKGAIVAFTVTVEDVTAKFKLSQRGSDGDIAGLLARLRASGSQKDALLADAMEDAARSRPL